MKKYKVQLEMLVAAMRRQYPVVEPSLSPEALEEFHKAESLTGRKSR